MLMRVTKPCLTITLSQNNLRGYVFWCAKHLHVFELRTVFVNGTLVQVCRNYNSTSVTSHPVSKSRLKASTFQPMFNNTPRNRQNQSAADSENKT